MGQPVLGSDFAAVVDRQLVGYADGGEGHIGYLEDCSCGERE
jgi:hypothetical protein